MFERFTQRARLILVLSREEAMRFGHDYVGTEHLLLGVLREGGGLAARSLGHLGITLDDARERVESIVGHGDEEEELAPFTESAAPFVPRSKKVLELSLREALQRGHNYISTEYLLLGLVRETEGMAVQILSDLGVEPEAVRQEVSRMLADEQGGSQSRGASRDYSTLERGQKVPGSAERPYDVVVIGSGPAGYTAALYAARAGLGTLLFQGFEMGGQLMLSNEIDDYPGAEPGILGPGLSDRFEAQAARFGAEMRPDNVGRVDLSRKPFRIWAEGEDEPVLARSVITATGARAKWLGLENEQRLIGRGVSGCAICDGFFFKDKRVAVIGGGDTAMEEALFLTKFASEVNIIHRRDAFRASWAMLQRVREDPKITLVTDTVVEDILGEHAVERLRLRKVNPGTEWELAADGVFIAIGSDPSTGLFRDQLQMDQGGYIVQHKDTMTSIPGIFAAGEVSDRQYRQAATAVGAGCRAALDAGRWLEG